MKKNITLEQLKDFIGENEEKGKEKVHWLDHFLSKELLHEYHFTAGEMIRIIEQKQTEKLDICLQGREWYVSITFENGLVVEEKEKELVDALWNVLMKMCEKDLKLEPTTN